MPYREAIFIKGEYYHIFNRGNRKGDIFLDNQDKGVFLERLIKYKDECQISILCYCLMPNHFHFLLKQEGEISVTNFIHRMLISYCMYFNKKYNTVGRLFQGPFKAKLVEGEEYLLQLSRYIHLNPGEIFKTRSLKNYLWSSYLDYIGKRNRGLCETDLILSYFSKTVPGLSYQNFVEQSNEIVLREQLSELILE